MYLKLASRNVFRNKRRTLITVISISVGVIAIIFLGSFLSGLKGSWSETLINAYSGHFAVTRSDYFEQSKSHPLKLTLSDIQKCYKFFDNQNEIESCMAKLDVGGMIGNGEKTTTFFGWGVDLTRQQKTLPKMFNSVNKGKGLDPDDTFGAVIAVGLAKNLNKDVGDTLLIVTNTIDGQLNAIEIVIRGILKTGQQQLDDNIVLLNIKAAQQLLAVPDRASEITVRLKPGINMDAAKNKFTLSVKNIDSQAVIKTWMDLNPSFLQVKTLFDSISIIVGVIIFIVIAAGLANTMIMSIFERINEIGTIMAMGTEIKQVRILFILETIFIGIIGAVIGLVIGITITLITSQTGIPFKPPDATEPMVIHPLLKSGNIITSVIFVFIMSLAATIFPVKFASNLEPVEALRHN